MVLSAKTRFFNVVRKGFTIPAVEPMLYRLTNGKTPSHFFSKFLPNHYQYHLGSTRRVRRDGIEYDLDLSDFVDHKIYFGILDPSEKILFSLVNEESVVIDIGSNNGHFALKMAAKAISGMVIGFEPDPRNYDRCLRNLALNSFSNLRIRKAALGDFRGEGILERSNPKNQGMNRMIQNQGKELVAESVNVGISRLDDLAEITDLEYIDLIKLDVEGYELKVLKGACNTLTKFRPRLFVEVDDTLLRAQGTSSTELLSFILDLDYSIHDAETDAELNHPPDFKPHHFDALCLPRTDPE